jgi:hypothetical protein
MRRVKEKKRKSIEEKIEKGCSRDEERKREEEKK